MWSMSAVIMAANCYAAEDNIREDPPLTNSGHVSDFSKIMSRLKTLEAKFGGPDRSRQPDVISTVLASLPVTETKVNKMEALTAPFSPENSGCWLPGKVAADLKEKRKKHGWAPRGLRALLSRIKSDELVKLDQQSVRLLMFTFDHVGADGKPEPIELRGTGTYSSVLVDTFVDPDKDRFIYSLDCSGYLNSAMSASASFQVADLESSAREALDSKKSMMLGYGFVHSPIAIALKPLVSSDKMRLRDRDRLDIIASIIAALPKSTPGTDIIVAPKIMQLAWTSGNGQSSFQGEGNFKGSAGAGIGIASINASGDAGFSMQRQSIYSFYDTFIVSDTESEETKMSVAEIKDILLEEIKYSPFVSPPKRSGDGYEFSIDIPQNVCTGSKWSFYDDKSPAVDISDRPAKPAFSSEKGCTFTVKFKDGGERKDSFIMSGKYENMAEAPLVLKVPM